MQCSRQRVGRQPYNSVAMASVRMSEGCHTFRCVYRRPDFVSFQHNGLRSNAVLGPFPFLWVLQKQGHKVCKDMQNACTCCKELMGLGFRILDLHPCACRSWTT
eukprot:1137651-Pelagomonas_calceolata.AAC.1